MQHETNSDIHPHEMHRCKKLLIQEGVGQIDNRINAVEAFLMNDGHVTLIPLAIATVGNKLIIKAYAGGIKSRIRLINMGLRIGDQLEVITNTGHGQMVIAIDHIRFVLGRGIAQKIMVERIM